MIACGRSEDDDDDCAENYGPPPPPPRTRSDDGGCERARQADRSLLLHGLSAATVALAALRILPAAAIAALAVCLVGLSPVLRLLPCSLLGLNGGGGLRRRSAEPSDGNGPGRSVPRLRRPLAPPAVPLMSAGALSVFKRGLRVLMRMMRRVQRSIIVRPKRFRRSSRRCRDTASTTVTTVTASTATRTVETVKGSRAGNHGYVQCTDRMYRMCTARELQR